MLFLAILLLISFSFYHLWFLRQPERSIPENPAAFISPANGEIVAVETWNTTRLEWEKDAGIVSVMAQEVDSVGWLIAIEMDISNVHYQRAPMQGRFLKKEYTPGKFNNALIKTNRFGLRLENERSELLFETASGLRYKVVQVAGLVARRIEDYLQPGQEVAAGQVIGLIKMGSQVALILPQRAQPTVKPGDKVLDGASIVAVLNQPGH